MAADGFFTKIAGVSHRNSDGTQRQAIVKRCREGEMLRLEREPDNPHDPNAVRILRQNGEQLGYLPANVAASGLASDLDKGCHFKVVLYAITGRDQDTLGVNIKITEVSDPVETLPAQPATGGSTLFWVVVAVIVSYALYKIMTAR